MSLPSGGSLAFEYAFGQPTRIADGDNNTIETRTYHAAPNPGDPEGRLASVTNRFGTSSNYTGHAPDSAYTDPFGNAVDLVSSGGVLRSRTEHGKTITVTRDNAERPTRYNFGDGKTVDLGYGGLTNEWTSISGPTIGRIERSFNRRGATPPASTARRCKRRSRMR